MISCFNITTKSQLFDTNNDNLTAVSGCQKRPSKHKGEKYQEQPPTRALIIMNGPLNGNLLLLEAPAPITGALTPVPI